MNKTKIMLAAVGGVIGVMVLAAAAFVYLQWSAKNEVIEGSEEGEVGLSAALQSVSTLQNAKVKPYKGSQTILEDSIKLMSDKHRELLDLARRGDQPIETPSPNGLTEYAKRVSDDLKILPIDSTEKIVEEGFALEPVRKYVEGEIPAESEVPRLYRLILDEEILVTMCAEAGVTRITKMDVTSVEEPKVDVKSGNKPKSNKSAKKKEDASFKPDSVTYQLVAQMKPAAFVALMNEMAKTDKRFLVVEDFSFTLVADPIKSSYKADKEKDKTEDKSVGRRGGKRRASALVFAEEENDETKSEEESAPLVMPITDPEKDSVYAVTLVVTVHDFKRYTADNKEVAK